MKAQAWRTLASGLLLVALLLACGDGLVRAVLPAMQGVFEALMPGFQVQSFDLAQARAGRVLQVEVTRPSYVFVGPVLVSPSSGGSATASTQVLQTFFAPTLALWVALAWPPQRATGRDVALTMVLRLALALPPAALLALVDAPVVLAAQLWGLMLRHYAPAEFSLLLGAADLLHPAGRYALGLASGAAAVLAAQALQAHWVGVGPQAGPRPSGGTV